MADVARIGIVVDADGAVRQIKLTSEELKKLANEGTKARDVMGKVAPPKVAQDMQRTTQAITQAQVATRTFNSAGPGVMKLQNAFGNLAAAAAGVPGPVGRVAQALGQFSVGGPITVMVLAGIAAITLAWRKFREEGEAAKKLMEELRSKEAQFGADALRARLRTVEIEREQLLYKQMGSGQRLGTNADGSTRFAPTFTGGDLRRLEEVQQHYGELSVAVNKLDRDLASAAITAKKTTNALGGGKDGQYAAPSDLDLIRQGFALMGDAADEAERFRKAFSDPAAGAFGGVAQEDIQAIIASIQKTIDGLTEGEKKALKFKAAMSGMAVGFGVGLLNRAGAEGAAIGGAVQGGIAGFGAAGPWGAAAGAAIGLVDGLFGIADSAKAARQAIHALRVQFEAFTDSEKESLGILSSLEARIKDVRRAYQEQREALHHLLDGANAMNPARIAEYNKGIQELNELERMRVDQLAKESEALTKLAEQERLDEMIGKTLDRIQSFTTAISGLEAFRNSLLLSDTKSPDERYTEAQRQYQELLNKARGGMKLPGYDGVPDAYQFSPEQMAEAAAQLPAAAQALLEISRLINASGSGFQNDFAQVLEDTQGLIENFNSLKTIEEQMLDELRRIREGTEQIVSGETPLVGGGGSGGSSTGGYGGTELLNVMSGGFELLLDETKLLRNAIEENGKSVKRAVEQVLH